MKLNSFTKTKITVNTAPDISFIFTFTNAHSLTIEPSGLKTIRLQELSNFLKLIFGRGTTITDSQIDEKVDEPIIKL
jgi:hypothetical protein